MAVRKIVHIDEEKCNGCGLCIPNCAEGALQIVDGKAKLVKDIYCDGLGACLGHCPQDAITIIEREADEFDEKAVEEHLKSQNKHEEVKSNYVHHHGHHIGGGCPGSQLRQFNRVTNEPQNVNITSRLRQWPVQLSLVPPTAPYLNGADLLITADCVPFAYGNYHNDFLKDRAVVVGCPKLDDIEYYTDKLTDIIKLNNLESITVLKMEVPCCSGMMFAAKTARDRAGSDIPIKVVTIGIEGDIIKREYV
ncbi:MAG: 4Fe-4S binding protein [Clostridiales bacterium]|nr:4Fe-4S binding protein [Clostridiales bacterium]